MVLQEVVLIDLDTYCFEELELAYIILVVGGVSDDPECGYNANHVEAQYGRTGFVTE